MATKKSFSKEQWEAMTGTEMSQFLPDGENLESTEESFTGDVGIETPLTVTEQSEIPSGNLQMPMGKDRTFSTPRCRVSSRQRRMSLEEYRTAFLQVPKIEDRKPVFVSCEVRDRLVRKLGSRRMSVSGLLENIARQHLEIYSEEFEQWRKL